MVFAPSCLTPPAQMPFKVECSRLHCKILCSTRRNKSSSIFTSGTMNKGLFKPQQSVGMGVKLIGDWGCLERSTAVVRPNLAECRKSRVVYVSCLPCPQLAYSAFTIGTAAVLPFYTSMVVAPKAEFTKKLMSSSIPYILLGLLYAYLLFLSWTPDTLRLMFSSKNWLPELPAIAKLFSSEMTLASAWIHLLVIDLFAARSFMRGCRRILKPGIQFLCVCCSVLLEYLLISLPKLLLRRVGGRFISICSITSNSFRKISLVVME